MKKAKSFILTLLVSLLSTVMYAQEFVCSGTVVDEQGEPIIGASVFLKGSKNGVFSDIKGEFRLENVAEGSPITISYIGCKTVETKAAAGMRVVMREDNEMLGEVVVVGYGVQKKSVVTASIAKVSSDELAATAPVRMDNALKGLAAGVTVTSSSGQPGAAARIRVRGIGPSDIESIEVLKDAASGAIYGARAANGVVLVTTKSGKKGKVKVNYNFSYGWQSKWRKRDVLNATEYAVMMNEGYINAGMKPLYADPYHLKDAMGNQVTDGTDWQDAVFNDNAPVMNHDLTVSGATDKVNYYLSLGYYTQEGIVGGNFDRSNYQRLSLRSNTRYNVLDLSKERKSLNKIDIIVNLSYARIKSKGIDTNSQWGSPLGSALALSPVLTPTLTGEAADAQDKFYRQTQPDYPGPILSPRGNPYTIAGTTYNEMVNPLAALSLPGAQNWSHKFVANFAAEMQIWDGLRKIFSKAGDYVLKYLVGNRNGFSQGIGSVTFHIDNSLVDYGMYFTMLDGKKWRIAKEEQGHLGCGESGTDGLGWYSAAPDEKHGTALYDDVITFSSDGTYTYSPGADGMVYANKGCTRLPGNPGDGNDFNSPAKEQTSHYTIEGRGNDVYLVLDDKTLFPYVSDDSQYDKPAFRIESVTGSKLVLVYDNGSIAWHYVLTSKDEVKGFDGFDADSEFNMFKGCTFTNEFYYAPGWNQIADPALTADGNSYTVSLPEATSDTWQAQVKFLTDMRTSAASHYDFSCKLMSNTDHNNVTVKLVKTGDDATYYFQETVSLKAYEEYVFYKSDMPGIDMDNVSLVFDFGGNAENTEVTVSDITLQEHGCDGITAPSEDEDDTDSVYDAETNLWKTHVDDTGVYTTEFYYAPGWTQIADPGFTSDGGTYTVTLPEATTDQWQAQVKIKTDIPADADTPYDFSCTLMADKELKGATIKLADVNNDADNFFFAERVDLAPYEEYVFKMPAQKLAQGAASGLMLIFDFGGCQAGTNVTINNIVLQKTAE